MEVQLRFKNKNHQYQVSEDATVDDVMNLIVKELAVPKEAQKIIFKGKPLTSPDEPIAGRQKLLLMESAKKATITNEVNNTHQRYGYFRPTIIDTLKEPNHQAIITQGPPEGALAGSKYQTSVLPQDGFVIRNTEGQRAVLNIESDAIFIKNDDSNCERVFFSDITRSAAIPIPGDESYFAMGIITKNGTRWLYFLPNQYMVVLRTIIPQ